MNLDRERRATDEQNNKVTSNTQGQVARRNKDLSRSRVEHTNREMEDVRKGHSTATG